MKKNTVSKLKSLVSAVIVFCLTFISFGCFFSGGNNYKGGTVFGFKRWTAVTANVFTIKNKFSGAADVSFDKSATNSSSALIESGVSGQLSYFRYVNFEMKASYEMTFGASIPVTADNSTINLLKDIKFKVSDTVSTYALRIDDGMRSHLNSAQKVTLLPRPGESGATVNGAFNIIKSYFSVEQPENSVLIKPNAEQENQEPGGEEPDGEEPGEEDTDNQEPGEEVPAEEEPDGEEPGGEEPGGNGGSPVVRPETPPDGDVYLKDLFDFPVGYAAGYRKDGNVQSGSMINYGAGGSDNRYKNLDKHFNSLTSENEMKYNALRNDAGVFGSGWAEDMITYAKAQGMGMRGHALVWFNHTRASFTHTGSTDSTPLKSKSVLLADMKAHIDGTLERLNASKYNNTIYAWDVVNEAIFDDYDGGTAAGDNIYRSCDLFTIAGEDYIFEAFKYADAKLKAMGVRDKVKLYYNDFNLNNSAVVNYGVSKRQRVLTMIQRMKAADIPIDGIGMQAHYSVPWFNSNDFKTAIEMFLATGLDVQITELDISIYKSADAELSLADYNNNASSLKSKQLNIYREIFRVIRNPRYQTGASGWGRLTGLTFWGIADDHTWIDTQTRKDYPLLFGLDGKCKIDLKEIWNYRDTPYYPG